LAGIYRTYYELVHWKEEFRNRVHVVIVADGYDKLKKEFLRKLEICGLFNAFETSNYLTAELSSDKAETKIEFKGMLFKC